MDPMTLMALGGLLGGGGGTKVSQSLQNNLSSTITSIIQGGGGSPSTGAVSQPQTGTAPSSASGSDGGSLPSLGSLDTSTIPTTPITTGSASLNPENANSWLYWGLAAAGVAVAFFLFNKRKR